MAWKEEYLEAYQGKKIKRNSKDKSQIELVENVPNDETLRVLKDTQKGKNLVHFRDVSDVLNVDELK